MEGGDGSVRASSLLRGRGSPHMSKPHSSGLDATFWGRVNDGPMLDVPLVVDDHDDLGWAITHSAAQGPVAEGDLSGRSLRPVLRHLVP